MNKKAILNFKNGLTNLESVLQKMIEGSVGHLLPGERQFSELPNILLQAMRDGMDVDQGGLLLMPNLYVLLVPPSELQAFEDNLELQEVLIFTLLEAAQEAGLSFSTPPVLRISPDSSLQAGQVQVLATNSLENISETTDAVVETESPAAPIPPNAFLIVDGTSIFPLEEVLVNIGRRPDNHLVLRNECISRLHAQLRAINGRYKIFDLDSTGGTMVNGQAVQQQILSPGDVISLSGLPLVYGQDEDERNETEELRLGIEKERAS